ncbi:MULTISPECIES: hypothetical protein [unclassified Clostridium]|uniref:hypothetical protein n=1 Tax=unclassified Clostridium TaxID=2614128 RepID=UPI00207A8572|nr:MULTISPECIES: hypothetical protein [unclassified Clostridium]
MNKQLKDNLVQPIVLGINFAFSISEALKIDYAKYKIDKKGYGFAVYRGRLIFLGIKDENESLWSSLQKEIDKTNMIEGVSHD